MVYAIKCQVILLDLNENDLHLHLKKIMIIKV